MAKKSMVQRNKSAQRLAKKYAVQACEAAGDCDGPQCLDGRAFEASFKLAELPRNSAEPASAIGAKCPVARVVFIGNSGSAGDAAGYGQQRSNPGMVKSSW